MQTSRQPYIEQYLSSLSAVSFDGANNFPYESTAQLTIFETLVNFKIIAAQQRWFDILYPEDSRVKSKKFQVHLTLLG